MNNLDPLNYLDESIINKTTGICEVDGCKSLKVYKSRPYCNAHYIRMRRHGTLEKTYPEVERHGMTYSEEYKIWQGLKGRCDNPNNTNYKNYGGRGIKVCEEWQNSFESFYNHIGKRPSKKYTVDRINNDVGYEPGNVRWSTYTEQVNNRRINKNNTSGYVGVSWNKTLKLWAAQITLNYKNIHLGYFKTIGEAIEKRKHAERVYHA